MMKKALQMIACGLGGAMIGFFANRLDTMLGATLFTLGILLLVGSIALTAKASK